MKKHLKRLVQKAAYSPSMAALARSLGAAARRVDGFLLNRDNDPALNGEFWLMDAFHDAELVLDVGFNQGEWSRRALISVANARVHAFDPDLTAAHYAAGLDDDRFMFHPIAVGAEDGTATFQSLAGANPNNSLARRRYDTAGDDNITCYDVDVRRLDSWAEEQGVEHIDLLKIDAEGFDLDVMRGARGLLERRSVDAIVFEYGYAWLDAGHLLIEAVRLFEALGYGVYRLYPGFLAPYRWHFTHENRVAGEFVAARPETAARLPVRDGPC